MSPSLREKYAARVDELLSLEVELEGGRRPGGPAPLVGRVLEAAGDLLRRSAAISPDWQAVERALQRVSDVALRSWSSAVAVSELEGRLRRAASQAVEAALPDDPDEAETIAGWAMHDLVARDRLESTLVALERLASLGRDDARLVAAHLRTLVGAVDSSCRGTITALTSLNAYRRPEAGLLDEPERHRAWWFAARNGIDDDLLVPILGGERHGTLPPAERDAGEVVMSKRARRLSYDELFRYDLGLSSDDEREAIRRRAVDDPELRLALSAIEEGDRAIDEATGGSEPHRFVVPLPVEPRGTPPDIIEENDAFRVLVFRGPRTVQVVVQPHDPRRLAAAAVFRSEAPDTPMSPVPGEHGLHFDLGAPERLHGQVARLVVKLLDGRSHFLDVQL